MLKKPVVLYLHGCFVGSKYSIFREAQLADGGLQALSKEIKSGELNYYCWAVDQNEYSFWQSCNPFCYLNTYLVENKYILTKPATDSLYKELAAKNPEIILTHSAGNRFLFEALNQFGPNPKLKKIITLSSDLPTNFKITNQDFIAGLETKKIIWENYYCFWDQALLSSSILNLGFRAGQFGAKSQFVKNIFYPLKPSLNFHTSVLNDAKFLKKVLTI